MQIEGSELTASGGRKSPDGAAAPIAQTLQYRQIDGGFLVQDGDFTADAEPEWKVVTNAQPTSDQLAELRFGWSMVRHVKSNAIVLSKDRSLVGVGAGQMSRVDSVEIAVRKAGEARQVRCFRATRFFRLVIRSQLRRKPALLRSFSPAAQCATTK